MAKGKFMILTCIILMFTLTLFGCGGNQSDQKESTSKQGQQGQQETLYIGFTGPLSGGAAKYGQNCLDGMNLALDEINSQGINIDGKNYKIELVTLDDRYLPNEAATNARRLVQQNKTSIVFCPHQGGISAMAQFNEKDNFIIAGYTSSPQSETLGNKLLLRIPTPYTWYLVKDGFVDQAMERFGKNVVCVPGLHEYAKGWTDIFVKTWEKSGGKVLGNFPVDYTSEADFYTPVSKALAAKPDVMFIGGPSEPTGLVIKQARELGFKGGFIVMDQAKENEIERFLPVEQLEGFIGTGAVVDYATSSEYAEKVGKTNKGAVAFMEKWEKRYGDKEATSESSYHYMTLHIFAKAIELAGTASDPKAIFAKLPAAIDSLPDEYMTRVIEGISDTGGFINVTLGCHVKDGKRVPFTMLAPEEYRARKLPAK